MKQYKETWKKTEYKAPANLVYIIAHQKIKITKFFIL